MYVLVCEYHYVCFVCRRVSVLTVPFLRSTTTSSHQTSSSNNTSSDLGHALGAPLAQLDREPELSAGAGRWVGCPPALLCDPLLWGG